MSESYINRSFRFVSKVFRLRCQKSQIRCWFFLILLNEYILWAFFVYISDTRGYFTCIFILNVFSDHELVQITLKTVVMIFVTSLSRSGALIRLSFMWYVARSFIGDIGIIYDRIYHCPKKCPCSWSDWSKTFHFGHTFQLWFPNYHWYWRGYLIQLGFELLKFSNTWPRVALFCVMEIFLFSPLLE